ncbi:GMC oxidoreductase-domain-containing protein [Mycena rosella]|uniref:GMC oxidoreductase-domain-containing protein n=1 Tax=Mycena rosella TaxID=1033263 RepID=A0AAD7GF07_MYCRO|nr:GMC oxidoreductase-domain-containing protein [Mycena rosella]
MHAKFASLTVLLSGLFTSQAVGAVPKPIDCSKVFCPAPHCPLGKTAEVLPGACCATCVKCSGACPEFILHCPPGTVGSYEYLANGDPHAVGIVPNSIDAAYNTRCSAACAYYTPFANRPNLVVIINATVSHILWANSTGGANAAKLTARGVEYYIVNNQPQSISFSKEVILSAGTIGSPKILELSGVGNSTILKAAGFAPVLSLPTVGENFADHFHSWANEFTNITLTKDALLLNPAFAAKQEALWFKNRRGLYSAVPRSLGIVAPSDVFTPSESNTLIAQAQANFTHFAEQFSNGNPALAKGIAAQHKIAPPLCTNFRVFPHKSRVEPGYSGPTSFSARPARNYTTISSVLYAPLSHGRTHIVSSDPLVLPAVDPAYWAHPSTSQRSIYTGEFEPGADKDTDTKIEDWLRSVVASDSHEVGSLSMMPQSLGGVVDTSLKVYGTATVRVAEIPQVHADSCAGASQASPLYRDYSSSQGDHFYTTDIGEYNSANANGYVPEGIRALVFTTQVASSVQLMRLWSADAGDHLYTTDPNEVQSAMSVYTYVLDNGPAMYVYPTQLCGSVPLYRMHNADIRDHFYTIDAAERDAAQNYAQEGITGYVFPPSAATGSSGGGGGSTADPKTMTTTSTTTTTSLATTAKTTTTTASAPSVPPASSESSSADPGLTPPPNGVVLPAPTTMLNGSLADSLPTSATTPGSSAAIRIHTPRLFFGLLVLAMALYF